MAPELSRISPRKILIGTSAMNGFYLDDLDNFGLWPEVSQSPKYFIKGAHIENCQDITTLRMHGRFFRSVHQRTAISPIGHMSVSMLLIGGYGHGSF
jgi:hypothetical protein